MVKVMTIRDEVYHKLNKVRLSRDGSFSDAIEHLLESYNRYGREAGIGELAGSVPKMKLNKRNVNRVVGNA
jgi:predicted CopG family antitoxin